MSTRLRFAGMEAPIGMIALLSFLVLGGLGAVGVILLLATGQVPPAWENLATIAGGFLLLGYFAWKVRRDLGLIQEIEITDDDTWILRSVFGIERARLAPTDARSLATMTQKRWILVGVARKLTVGWAEIEANGKVWKTTQNPPSSQRPAIDTLRAWMTAHS